MCSTPDERLARLRAAIDALAAQSVAAGDPVAPADTGDPAAGAGQAEDIDTRLARLWQMLAQLDPELARRLPHYLA